MSSGFTTDFRDVRKQLAELPNAVSRSVQVKTLTEAAEPIRAMAASLAPRQRHRLGPGAFAPHLADHIIVAVPTVAQQEAKGTNETIVLIGPHKDFFWGYFQEIGTAFHSAHPFMRPAFDSEADTSLRMITAAVWDRIQAALRKGAAAAAAR